MKNFSFIFFAVFSLINFSFSQNTLDDSLKIETYASVGTYYTDVKIYLKNVSKSELLVKGNLKLFFNATKPRGSEGEIYFDIKIKEKHQRIKPGETKKIGVRIADSDTDFDLVDLFFEWNTIISSYILLKYTGYSKSSLSISSNYMPPEAEKLLISQGFHKVTVGQDYRVSEDNFNLHLEAEKGKLQLTANNPMSYKAMVSAFFLRFDPFTKEYSVELLSNYSGLPAKTNPGKDKTGQFKKGHYNKSWIGNEIHYFKVIGVFFTEKWMALNEGQYHGKLLGDFKSNIENCSCTSLEDISQLNGVTKKMIEGYQGVKPCKNLGIQGITFKHNSNYTYSIQKNGKDYTTGLMMDMESRLPKLAAKSDIEEHSNAVAVENENNVENESNVSPVSEDLEEKLVKLKGLYDKELITKQEYDIKRKELLSLDEDSNDKNKATPRSQIVKVELPSNLSSDYMNLKTDYKQGKLSVSDFKTRSIPILEAQKKGAISDSNVKLMDKINEEEKYINSLKVEEKIEGKKITQEPKQNVPEKSEKEKKLEQLEQLLNVGAISQEEYESLKSELK